MHIYKIYQLFTSPYRQYMADYAKASTNLLFVRKKIDEKGINPELHQELAAAESALNAEYAKVKGVYQTSNMRILKVLTAS